MFLLVKYIFPHKLNPPAASLDHPILLKARVLASVNAHTADEEVVEHLHLVVSTVLIGNPELHFPVLFVLIDLRC